MFVAVLAATAFFTEGRSLGLGALTRSAMGIAAALALALGATACRTVAAQGGKPGAPGASAAPSQLASHEEIATVREGRLERLVRVTGQTLATQSFTVRVPRFRHSGGDLTLTHIITNGATVHKGDVLVRFDETVEVQNAQAALAQFDDLSHQVQDKMAQNRSAAEQRAAALQAAEAALGKAQLELRKAPILSTIDAKTDQVNVDDATAQIASLKRSNHQHDLADAAALKILILQRDQQNREYQRANTAVQEMTIRAPLSGMVALIPSWHNGTFARPQEGDQLWGGGPLLRIFSPTGMEVQAAISEADGGLLTPGLPALVHLDAYPNAQFHARFNSVSPVATAPMDSPVHSYSALFSLQENDPRIMPDLSAAVDLEVATGTLQLLAPRDSVHFVQSAAYVTEVGADGSRHEQRVELGEFDTQNIVLTAGVHAGDRLLVGPTSTAGAAPAAGL